MPRKLGQRRDADLGKLISRLEEMHEEMGGNEKKMDEEANMDEFTRLKKMSARQVAEIRKMITERDDLLDASSGSGGKQSVQLSSKIREMLRGVQETHKKMQTQLHQEEKDLAKGKKKSNLTAEDLEQHAQMVDLVSKHITECEQLEKKRAEATDLDPIDLDPEVGEGLVQLKRNDQKLDEQLELISKGMTRLKGIAVDQSNEVKLQGVMIDQIADNMDKATGHLNQVNAKLKETLAKAGGATSIIVKIILLVLLIAVAAYLYKMFA